MAFERERRDELEDGIRRGRGRPKKDDAYDYVLKARIGTDELYLLQDLENEFELSRAEIIRKAIHTYHNLKMKFK